MGIGISVLLLAIGGLLTFAVTAEVSGVDLDAVGAVLMVAGAIGLVWALIAAPASGRSAAAKSASSSAGRTGVGAG